MRCRRWLTLTLFVLAALATGNSAFADGDAQPGRDPKQPLDEAYTAKIHKYTTQPYFSSPLVDYLPASKNVPTPDAVLGDIAGAPGILPYAEDVYKYMRLLEKATPRVKVFSIGTTEEGREMIAVAVSSEANLKNLEQNHQRLAELADPRTIQLNDAGADKIVAEAVPVYYITGTIHSTERSAHRSNGAGLSTRRGRKPVHSRHPRWCHHSNYPRRRSRRPRPYGRSLQMASRAPERYLSAADLLGQVCRPRQQSRCHGRHPQVD